MFLTTVMIMIRMACNQDDEDDVRWSSMRCSGDDDVHHHHDFDEYDDDGAENRGALNTA